MDTQKSHKIIYTMASKECILLPRSISFSFLPKLMFLTIFLSSINDLNIKSSALVSGAIASVGEPDWSISKADLVDYLYSYEPYEPGREFRSLFPFFRQPQQTQPQAQLQQQTQQQRSKITFPNPTTLFHPGMLNLNLNNKQNPTQSNSNYLPLPNPTQQPPSQAVQGYANPSQNSVPDQHQYQVHLPPQPPPATLSSSYQVQPEIKLLPESSNPVAPKFTKFSLNDKKLQTQPRFSLVQNQPDSPELTTTSKPTPIGPVYFNPLTSTTTTTSTPVTSPSQIQTVQPDRIYQDNKPQQQNEVKQPQADSSVLDSQTIIWPQNVEDTLTKDDGESQIRFLVHKPGDEEIIRNALEEDGKNRNQDVKFIEGPMLRIQRHQKVYLPPKKKTVVYILLKEPQIVTDVEVVGPTEEPVPEVFITYQKSDGAIKTKHYSPEVVKNDKYLSQLKNSAATATGANNPTTGLPPSTGSGNTGGYNYQDSSNIDNNYNEQQLQAASQNIERIHNLNGQQQQQKQPERVHIRSVADSQNPQQEPINIMCPVAPINPSNSKNSNPPLTT